MSKDMAIILHQNSLQEYSHELTGIISAIGIASDAIGDSSITAEEIKNIINKVQQKLQLFHQRLCPTSTVCASNFIAADK